MPSLGQVSDIFLYCFKVSSRVSDFSFSMVGCPSTRVVKKKLHFDFPEEIVSFFP